MNWLTIMLEKDYHMSYLERLKTGLMQAVMFGVNEAPILLM